MELRYKWGVKQTIELEKNTWQMKASDSFKTQV